MKISWITGAHGFIGRNLARYLSGLGHTVCGIGHGGWPAEEAKEWGIDYWLGGEIDGSNLAELAMRYGAPQRVFHLAGGASVGKSLMHPLEDFRRSVNTSARLLDWLNVAKSGASIVLVSSAAVYGAQHDGPIPETAPVTPCSPYGFHKAMMEMLCESYVRNYGMPIAVVRLFSVYGTGLEKQLLWDLCSKLKDRPENVVLGGTGDEVRDWVHVSDVVRLLESVEAASGVDQSPRIINGGSGVGISVREIAELVCSCWGGGIRPKFSKEVRPGDPATLVADIALARSTGYAPLVPLRNGIAEFVSWFKDRTN
jgi:UDP-glucose 4-epimerase